uniref:Uncharacterized protein n=1 Tax=viral metagenome TaxID=1070528 RepID=A0A6M3K5E6_9ZZZZ
MRLKQYLIDEFEYIEFCNFIDNYSLNEGILDTVIGKLKEKIDLIKDVANKIGMDFGKLAIIFKDKKIFTFFQKIGWSFVKLFELVKKGFKLANTLSDVIAEYIAKNKVVQWTTEKLKDLDEYLSKHPKTRMIVGIAVAAILIYIWLNMTFVGDPSYDFNMGDILLAMAGKMSIAGIFGGANGIKLLMLFATGLAGLSFPWPGPTSIKFTGAVIGSLIHMIKKKFPEMRMKLTHLKTLLSRKE